MTCSHCQCIDRSFDRKVAERDLRTYRTRGPARTTRLLLEALNGGKISGLTLLDIGGGIGVIQQELLKQGASSATAVDASRAYLQVAGEEAERQGTAGRIRYHFGNFVDLAEQIPQADIVTLEKVICCYPDMHALVGLSSNRARKLYGLVFPRDIWWIRWAAKVINWFMKLGRDPFPIYMHRTEDVDAILLEKGLQRCYYHQTLIWQVMVYERQQLSPSNPS
jgi:magnesium-protoporphyrin O-methyltransferase